MRNDIRKAENHWFPWTMDLQSQQSHSQMEVETRDPQKCVLAWLVRLPKQCRR